jgi:hypothetical protein
VNSYLFLVFLLLAFYVREAASIGMEATKGFSLAVPILTMRDDMQDTLFMDDSRRDMGTVPELLVYLLLFGTLD